ncbi:MAG: hypothetical protein COZ37_00090 [bacterium (Candidatus Ratteibacteria) CG_4_10_14_3_um_filter_41_18]|uniref:Fis family transcriptional regulator n=4 Tax=Candidatus Ratteibacteria TaxID=2979319 RepID=A0A2M7E803_9BACT|nr:MAG: hypothetical protein COS11_05080 [bacterium (Candidatus Ratteibacteria) CG01_land_8_20_14_3_00_40_19]PIW33506.1 MAG: hypothetical protein COW28_03900 [bacterium (Candidatus Ratteibacteria) CG15_BIG_FIL_POST_REV_8_21_14_020_41_12]PIX77930.1 MAG: hypothetical protein COZ37_00090 [bacterium (Candidatus Ratteibacteria) CG_4_10_14_3_um_filter_41_18]PJA62020.1 MAG: hypothetical protein CO162_03270 [bacterium (Candidatus Ratteibacteria) CG_4_9_14_3_um_filter_41_21]HCG76735.1 hypothetical prote
MEEAVVFEVKDKKAKIKIKRSKSCRGCGLCSLNPEGMMVTEVEDPIGVKVGDKVRVEIPDKDFLKAASILYLLPVSGLIIGALIGSKFNPRLGIFGGFIGLALSFVLVHYYDKRIASRRSLYSRITKVLKGG